MIRNFILYIYLYIYYILQYIYYMIKHILYDTLNDEIEINDKYDDL